jgi:CheY-like chemotaxis protein
MLKSTLLIVDDSAAFAEDLREILEDEGFACSLALDANEALRQLRCEPSPPDVILADLRMPGTPVEELWRIVRTTPEWSRIAFVLMTAGTENALPCGPFDGVLAKPFGVDCLLQTLRSAVEHRNRARTSPTP